MRTGRQRPSHCFCCLRIGAEHVARSAPDGLAKLGAEPNFAPPEAFSAFLQSEYSKWIKLTRDADIRIDLQ